MQLFLQRSRHILGSNFSRFTSTHCSHRPYLRHIRHAQAPYRWSVQYCVYLGQCGADFSRIYPRRAKPADKANTHSVWAALQQHVNGSVDITVAVVQCDHGLVLVLACNVDKLLGVEKQQNYSRPITPFEIERKTFQFCRKTMTFKGSRVYSFGECPEEGAESQSCDQTVGKVD